MHLLFEETKHEIILIKSQSTYTAKNLLGQYFYNMKFAGHPILENASSVYFILKNVSQKSKRYKKFIDDKLVEIALKKGINGLDLDMELHTRIKQEISRKNDLKKNDTSPIDLIREGIFDNEEQDLYGEGIEEGEEPSENRQIASINQVANRRRDHAYKEVSTQETKKSNSIMKEMRLETLRFMS